MIGYALCGSFCTHKKSLEELKKLKAQGYDILPIMSDNVYNIDTRFGKAEDLKKEIEEITKNSIFFKGDIYDAYSVLLEIFNLAKEEIIIIDN